MTDQDDEARAQFRASVADWVRRSRAAQGLPPKVVDPKLLADIRTILLGPRDTPPSR